MGGSKSLQKAECMLVAQLCLSLCDPMDCSSPASFVSGIFQARIPEWVAISFSRGPSQPRDWTWVSHIAGRFFIIWATREDNEGTVMHLRKQRAAGWPGLPALGPHSCHHTTAPHFSTPRVQCLSSPFLSFPLLPWSVVVHSYRTLCTSMNCSLPGSSVHGISQVRILELVAVSFSRGSSWPRNWTCVSRIDRRILYHWATREAPLDLSFMVIQAHGALM